MRVGNREDVRQEDEIEQGHLAVNMRNCERASSGLSAEIWNNARIFRAEFMLTSLRALEGSLDVRVDCWGRAGQAGLSVPAMESAREEWRSGEDTPDVAPARQKASCPRRRLQFDAKLSGSSVPVTD